MPHPLRRSDRGISRKDARAILEEAPFVVISTVDEEGNPYGVPLSFVLRDDALYIHCARDGGRKLNCFRHDARASATAALDIVPFCENANFTTKYRSAMAFGRMREVREPAEFKRALADLCLKYVPAARSEIGRSLTRFAKDAAVWALDIEELTGKAR